MEFGEFLRMKRKVKRMSIRKLALYAGCSDSYLSLLERGERGKRGPTPAFLRKLASPLGVPYEVMMAAAGYNLPTDKQALYAGELVQFIRESIGENIDQFAKRVELSNTEIETLESQGVSAETLQMIFGRLFVDQRTLTPTQKELLQHMGKTFHELPRGMSVKLEKLIVACLELAGVVNIE